jgi:alpha,alpha-trehalase
VSYGEFRKQNANVTDPAARKAALAQFVNRYFSPPLHAQDNYVFDPDQDVVAHIDTLWNVLLRQPDACHGRAPGVRHAVRPLRVRRLLT